MTPIRLGLIGAGQIAASAVHAVRGYEAGAAQITAAHDLSAERLADLCRSHAIPRAHARVEDLLADDEVDAVYIAVPNAFHAPLARQALAAGKHVILDKPFALSAAEAEGVIAAAGAAGRIFTLGMNQRFVGDCQRMRRLVADGVLGEVYHTKAAWMRRSGIPRLGTWFGQRKLAGGGSLYDIGVHLLDLAMWVTGRFDPVSVMGQTYTRFGDRGLGAGSWGRSDPEPGAVFDVDDFATALIRFADGATITLDVSWAAHTDQANRNDVLLYGTEAGGGCYPARLFRPDPAGGYAVIDAPKAEALYPHTDRFHNFFNAIRGIEPLCCTADQALAVQRVLDAIAESARTGRSVDIAPRAAAAL